MNGITPPLDVVFPMPTAADRERAALPNPNLHHQTAASENTPSAPPAPPPADHLSLLADAAAISHSAILLRSKHPLDLTPNQIGQYMKQLTDFTRNVDVVVPSEHIIEKEPAVVAQKYLHYYRELNKGLENLTAFDHSANRNIQLAMMQEATTYRTLLNSAALTLSQARNQLEFLRVNGGAQTADDHKAIAEIDDCFSKSHHANIQGANGNVVLRTAGEGAGESPLGRPSAGVAGAAAPELHGAEAPTHNPIAGSGNSTMTSRSTNILPKWVIPTIGVSGGIALIALTTFLILRARRNHRRKRMQAAMAQRAQQYGQMPPVAEPMAMPMPQNAGMQTPLAQAVGPATQMPAGPEMQEPYGLAPGAVVGPTGPTGPFPGAPIPNAPNFNSVPGMAFTTGSNYDPLLYYSQYGTQGF